MSSIGLAEIKEAHARIAGAVAATPCSLSESMSRVCDNKLFFKRENLQLTGSFKERGALNKLLTLSDDERKRGVIAASAGNHAQAVAYHAVRLNIRATIFMPESTPLIKAKSTRDHGAEVILAGDDYDGAYAAAQGAQSETGQVFIRAFDDDMIIAGQGTIGLELLEQCPQLDAVVVSIGGGGMIAGIACALKESNANIKVIGVQSRRVPSMKAALEKGEPVTVPAARTIADGIGVRRVGERTLPLVQRYVDDIVIVDEEEIANAILLLLEKEKTVAEGAGAASVAALVQKRVGLAGQNVAAIISGGNIDVNFLSRIIERGLKKDGRLVRCRVRIPDHPGALHGLTGLVAAHRANVIEITHARAYHGANLGETVVDLTLETRGPEHILELEAALSARDYPFERIL